MSPQPPLSGTHFDPFRNHCTEMQRWLYLADPFYLGAPLPINPGLRPERRIKHKTLINIILCRQQPEKDSGACFRSAHLDRCCKAIFDPLSVLLGINEIKNCLAFQICHYGCRYDTCRRIWRNKLTITINDLTWITDRILISICIWINTRLCGPPHSSSRNGGNRL